MPLKRKFKLFEKKHSDLEDFEIPLEERRRMLEKSRRHLPRQFEFGDAIEHERPVLKCVYCGQPVFEVADRAAFVVVSCNTPGCLGNQDTPQAYVSAKLKLDNRLGIRNGVWRI